MPRITRGVEAIEVVDGINIFAVAEMRLLAVVVAVVLEPSLILGDALSVAERYEALCTVKFLSSMHKVKF